MAHDIITTSLHHTPAQRTGISFMHQWSSLLDACVVLDYPGCWLHNHRFPYTEDTNVSILCEEEFNAVFMAHKESEHGTWRVQA